MTLTEVVFKIKSESFPLCQATDRSPDLKVVINHLSWDDASRVHRTLMTFSGPDVKLQEMVRDAERLFDSFEIIRQSKDQVTAKTVASLDLLHKAANPVAFSLEYFGENVIHEPGLVKEGYLHTRLVATEKVDLARMLARYEDGVKQGRWNDFKLIRIDEFDPEQQVHGAFTENLTQKQLEVIKTALALGFYNTPRTVTLDDLSNIFGISKAAVHNRLQAAERKVISKFFA